jgi:Ca2+-binding EF-hand superfamily protein
MSNKAAALAWSLISGDGSKPANCEFNDQDVLQLKGIFMSLDSDKDEKLTFDQVVKAFKLVGLNPKESTITPYFLNENGLRAQGIPFDSFIQILSEEKRHLVEVKEQLDSLFSFIDDKDTGTISVAELEQLLTAPTSPFRFTKPEFGGLLLTLDCGSREKRLSVSLLKSKLLFGLA